MEGDRSKGVVCVTGGTGFLGSWLIFKLLEHGYSVNATIRASPDRQRDVSFLTNLPGASERLHIFNADLDKPDSFSASIEGCIGVFHVAHPMDLEGTESEEENTKKAINGTLGILQACLKAKTVKRVIYTSSASAVMPDNNGLDIVDESTWTNTASLQELNSYGVAYTITKTLTEKACLEFAENCGLDFVTVIPTWIHGPFITPYVPGSVQASMAMIFDTPSMSIRYCLLVPHRRPQKRNTPPFRRKNSLKLDSSTDMDLRKCSMMQSVVAKRRAICNHACQLRLKAND